MFCLSEENGRSWRTVVIEIKSLFMQRENWVDWYKCNLNKVAMFVQFTEGNAVY